jgi:UDP-N-acetyl-D-glucosamine dehydrogenase
MMPGHVSAADALATRIENRSARIGIIGLGYVGLPTAVAFAETGFDVTGVDIDGIRCAGVNNGRSHIVDVSSARVAELVAAGRLRAVSTVREATDCDIYDICVPTPLDKSRDPDVSAILAVTQQLRDVIRSGQLFLLTSTTYPGTTVELVQPALEAAGLAVGDNVFLAFAPERIDPGNERFQIRNTPKVVGGVTPECTRLAQRVFETIVDTVIPVSGPGVAEMTKLLENTFRSVNIALANEVAIMCRRLGLDVWEVIDAASSKPYGFMPFYPGPGLGGHCIPVDPSYLSWKLRRLDYVARFIDLADDINRHMPDYVVTRIGDLLNAQSKSIRGARILILGVAYKPNVGDLRESPALDVIDHLLRRGAVVSYADPHVPDQVEVDGGCVPAVDLTPEVLTEQDIVVVTTDHAAFDWAQIRRHSAAVLDTRGVSRRRGFSEWHSL